MLDENFSIDIVYETFLNPVNTSLAAKVIIRPEESQFNYYMLIEENGTQKCLLLLYCGKPTDYYIPALFSTCEWVDNNSLVLKGKSKESEFHVSINTGERKLINHTKYEKPPFFEMMRADIGAEAAQKANENWLNSLPPGVADFLGEDESQS